MFYNIIRNRTQRIFIKYNNKIVKTVTTSQDAIYLQRDIENLEKWSAKNCLFLNIVKCKFKRYNSTKNPIGFNYHISGSNLKSVFNFKNFSVVFDPKLNFSEYTWSGIKQCATKVLLKERVDYLMIQLL